MLRLWLWLRKRRRLHHLRLARLSAVPLRRANLELQLRLRLHLTWILLLLLLRIRQRRRQRLLLMRLSRMPLLLHWLGLWHRCGCSAGWNIARHGCVQGRHPRCGTCCILPVQFFPLFLSVRVASCSSCSCSSLSLLLRRRLCRRRCPSHTIGHDRKVLAFRFASHRYGSRWRLLLLVRRSHRGRCWIRDTCSRRRCSAHTIRHGAKILSFGAS